MEKEFKTQEIMQLMENIRGLLDKKLPFVLIYKITTNIKAFNSIVESFYEVRNKVYEQYVEKNESGEFKTGDNNMPVILGAENQKGFVDEMNALFNTTNMITIQTIKIDELSVLDTNSKFDALSTSDMLALDFMIEK